MDIRFSVGVWQLCGLEGVAWVPPLCFPHNLHTVEIIKIKRYSIGRYKSYVETQA